MFFFQKPRVQTFLGSVMSDFRVQFSWGGACLETIGFEEFCCMAVLRKFSFWGFGFFATRQLDDCHLVFG